MILCFCLLLGSGIPVKAAQAPLTSLTFDMDYYYNTNPDLQSALGCEYRFGSIQNQRRSDSAGRRLLFQSDNPAENCC